MRKKDFCFVCYFVLSLLEKKLFENEEIAQWLRALDAVVKENSGWIPNTLVEVDNHL